MNRRGFLTALGAAGATAALSGCAGTGIGFNTSDTGDANTIRFWSNHPGQSKTVELELINRFRAHHPDLAVRLVDAGRNYDEVSQKFNAALAGGDLPDVVVLSDVWWFPYALTGAIEPLDTHLAEAGIDTADYVPSLLADYRFGGRHFALPYARSTPLFYYNRDVWARAGLPDRGPHTWQEFDEWGPQLQRVIGSGRLAHGWADAKNFLSWAFEGPLWSMGGAYSDGWTLRCAAPATVAAVQFLSDMVHVKRYAAISDAVANDFSAGIVASMVDSTGDLAGFAHTARFPVGTAPLPTPAGVIGCPTGGAGLAIPARISQARKDNAVKFIAFLTDAANTGYFSREVGYLPVRSSVVNDPSERNFLAQRPNFGTAVAQLPHTKPQDYARVFVPGGDFHIGTALERICLQHADVGSTLAALQATLQQIIDRQITPHLR